MAEFTATVTVECETAEQAKQVLAERLNHDEDYGFDYTLSHTAVEEKLMAWFINEDGGVYQYNPTTQEDHYPNDFHTPYESEAAALAAAEEL